MKKLIVISLLILAGCAAKPILANGDGIAFQGANAAKAAAAAQQHCNAYGKNATLIGASPSIISFRCE